MQDANLAANRIKVMKAIAGSHKTASRISTETDVSLTTVYRALKELREKQMLLVHGRFDSGKKVMEYKLRPNIPVAELPKIRVVGAILLSPKSVSQISEQENVSYTTTLRVIQELKGMNLLNVSARIGSTNKEWLYVIKPGHQAMEVYEALVRK